MKRLITFLLALICCNLIFAQQTKVLLEMITATGCKYCPSANHYIDSLADLHHDKVAVLRYQLPLSSYDPMYYQDSADINKRALAMFGDLSQLKLPGTYCNGNYATDGYPMFFTSEFIDSVYQSGSKFRLNIDHAFTSDYDSITVNLSIISGSAMLFQPGVLKGFLVLMEDSIFFSTPPGNNGEKHFFHECRKFISGPAGFNLPESWSAGMAKSYSFTFPVPGYIYDLNNLYITGFIQEMTGKKILQSVSSNQHKLQSYAGIDKIKSLNIAPFTCDTVLTGCNVMVKNLGIAPLNSFKLLYALDANPYDTITWLGLAAMDSTRTVVLPSLYLKGDGHHQIKTRVILPNGVHVAESYANQFVATIEVNRTPMDPPLNEYFKRPHFPYSGWFIHNQNRDGNSWYQISDKSYPGNFTQTALFLRSFTMMPGTVNEFYLPEMAMHQISPMVLSFDVCLIATGGDPDTLSALMSDNCGLTWTEVYRKTGSELAFTSVPWPEFTGGFPDSTDTDAWKQQIINVTGYNSNSNLLVKIKHIHGHGNNLSIRNLHFGPQLGIHDKTDIPLKISPNPTPGIVWIHSRQDISVQSVDILNALGKIVRSFKPETQNSMTYEINLSDQPAGIYLLKINTLNGFKTITTILVK